MIFHFSVVLFDCSALFIFHSAFHLLYNVNMLCLLLYFIKFQHTLLPFHCRNSTVLSQWINHGMRLHFVLFISSILHFMNLLYGYYYYNITTMN